MSCVRIVVTHLTRMDYPYICAAGLDKSSGQRIRPMPMSRRLSLENLRSQGGAFALGAEVELSLASKESLPSPPHVEDRVFAGYCYLSQLNSEDFWQLLKEHCAPDMGSIESTLQSIFGVELRRHGRTWIVPEGKGKASLGEIKLKSRDLRLSLEQEYDDIRASLGIGENESIAVNDLRLYKCKGTCWEVDLVHFNRLQELLKQSGEVIISLGLTRPWSKAEGEKRFHWLQVNNIYPDQDPLFRTDL